MKYQEIKARYQERLNMWNKENGLFYAFSEEQLKEGMKLNPSKKYTSIGMGGYLPSENVDKWNKGFNKILKQQKEEIKQAKKEQENAILYELNNYEAFYSGDLEPVIELFKGIYTKKDVQNVYWKHTKLGTFEN